MLTRSEFIKALGFASAGLFLPESSLITYKQIKIYDNYIRGVQFTNYEKIKDKINESDAVLLKRDKNNKYDSYAVEIFFREIKIGYIAAFENIVIANMIDAGVDLAAVISKKRIHKYRPLAVAIYAQLAIPTDKLVNLIKQDNRADDSEDIYRKGYKF